MANKRHYDEISCVRSLSKKNGCSINKNGNRNTIEFDNTFDLGKGSWGKIDYLVHYCNYIIISSSYIRKNKVIQSNIEETINVPNKINIVSSVRNIMNKVKLNKTK